MQGASDDEPGHETPAGWKAGARGQADVLPVGVPSRAAPRTVFPALHWGGMGAALAGMLATELEDRRAFLFLPVGLAVGMALYFGATHEPVPYVALLPFSAFALLAYWAREKAAAFYSLSMLAVIAFGFAIASLQVQRISHPVLGETLTAVQVAGFVEAAEQRPRGSRITLLVTSIGRTLPNPPERVRVTLASKQPPAIGDHVSLRATLGPPPGPAYPGGFDFGRSAWFEGIGATGFALGKAKVKAAPVPPPLALRFAAWLDRSREAIAARIRIALPGETGGIAVALVTGLRDGVGEPVEETMRVAGLSHVLSISGLHMALVATTVFFLVRALLALSPALSLRHPIKSWAAVPAVLAATYYLLLSGNEVPTQRSYIMTLLVLFGIMVGRPALTLHTLALAALVVLALTPWSILDPGAQMSFAATLALIAAYERFGRRLFVADGQGAARIGNMAVRYIAALVLTSLAAGLATAPFAAFHFQRLAPLSLLANLAAMPLVSFIVMPAGLVGAMLMPFGWDEPVWHVMGWGIDLMRDVAEWVAAIPGADSGISAVPMASLILLSIALLAVCLFRTRLIVLAPVLAGVAMWVDWRAPSPDLFVDSQGRTVAVRDSDGRLSLMGDKSSGVADRFAVEQWLSADGERSRFGAKDLTTAAACDSVGCTLRTAEGGYIALSRSRASLEDDCRHAAVLVTTFPPPEGCAAQIIHVDARRQIGGISAFLKPDGGWEVVQARPSIGTRPWYPTQPIIAQAAKSSSPTGAVKSTGPPSANGVSPTRDADLPLEMENQ